MGKKVKTSPQNGKAFSIAKIRNILFSGANGRVLLLRLLARFHCALVVAVGCAGVFEMLKMPGLPAYLRGLLFCIPMALSYYAAEKLPSLWQFLLASLLISGLSWLLLGHPGGAVLAAIVCFFRGRARLSEEYTRSLFDAPNYGVLGVFLAAFLVSAVLGIAGLQKLSVLSAVLYFLVCLAYRGIERLEEYLTLNRDMNAMPVRRIQRLAGGAVAAALLLAAVLLLPAALRFSGGFRITLPEFHSSGIYTPPEAEPPQTVGTMPSMAELFGEDSGPVFQIPEFLSYLLYALSVGGVAALILYGIYKLFKHFRASYTDSRDVVQSLSGKTDKDAEEKTEKRKRPGILDRSPNAVIRRQYRKQVLRAASDQPKRWQSPQEIEAWAGLAEPRLHELYEKARYGPVPCTAEELRSLRQAMKENSARRKEKT